MQIATEIETFTCICCPLGCNLEVSFLDDGSIEVEGNTCKRGAAYALEEATCPKRMVSALARVSGSLEPLSVKTAAPVPKDKVLEVLSCLRALHVNAPIHTGDVVLQNVCDTGTDVIATKDIL